MNIKNLLYDVVLFSNQTFKNANWKTFLKKAKIEIMEVENEKTSANKVTEYADVINCIFAAAHSEKISPMEILYAMKHKLEINKSREWYEIEPGLYQHSNSTNRRQPVIYKDRTVNKLNK